MTEVRRSFVVRGRVQGVAFRAHTRDAAAGLGVTGFVANRPDGSVHGECQGPVEAVEVLLDAVRRGPSWARVDEVVVSEIEPVLDDASGFSIRR